MASRRTLPALVLLAAASAGLPAQPREDPVAFLRLSIRGTIFDANLRETTTLAALSCRQAELRRCTRTGAGRQQCGSDRFDPHLVHAVARGANWIRFECKAGDCVDDGSTFHLPMHLVDAFVVADPMRVVESFDAFVASCDGAGDSAR